MNRREFALAATASIFPRVGFAQSKPKRIGALLGFPPDDPEGQSWIGAFLGGLQALGWVNGKLPG